jgi:hypothetical protein
MKIELKERIESIDWNAVSAIFARALAGTIISLKRLIRHLREVLMFGSRFARLNSGCGTLESGATIFVGSTEW